MRRLMYVPLWALVLLPSLGAQVDPAAATPEARYRALARSYQDAQQVYTKAYAAAETEAQRHEIQARKPDPAAFAQRFLDLAKELPGDRASFDALSWVLNHAPKGSLIDQALKLLAAGHLAEPRLIPILKRLGSYRSPAAEPLLRAALENSPDREIQAHACHTLALMLSARMQHVPPARHQSSKAKKSQTVQEPEKTDALREEVEVLYGRMLKDFHDIKYSRKQTYGDVALAALEKFKPSKSTGDCGSAAHVGRHGRQWPGGWDGPRQRSRAWTRAEVQCGFPNFAAGWSSSISGEIGDHPAGKCTRTSGRS